MKIAKYILLSAPALFAQIGASQVVTGEGRDTLGTEQVPNFEDVSVNRADEIIAMSIRSRLGEREDLSEQAKNIVVFVKDGSVRLFGTVESEDEKDLIELVARGVAGAESVSNRIVVLGH